MITAETLSTFAPRISNAEEHAAALEQARLESSVTTTRRLCHFMGQVFVETAGFTVMEENLNYRNPERLDAVFSAVRGVEDAKALIARSAGHRQPGVRQPLRSAPWGESHERFATMQRAQDSESNVQAIEE